MAEKQPKYPEQESPAVNEKPHHRARRWILIIVGVLVVLFVAAAIIGHVLSHVGKVTAFTATSITIKPVHGGTATTYTITSSTREQISPSRGSVKYNPQDVHVGEVVTVATDGPGSKQAAVILLYSR